MTAEEPHLIGNLHPADLTHHQLTGRSCVYCDSRGALSYAGWVRTLLSPGRYLSAPVSACAACQGGHDQAEEAIDA